MSSPNNGLEIRSGSDADIPGVIELMRAALGEGEIPRTSEFWTWKHRQNPFGPSPMWLALDGERIVGVRLFLRWRWQHGARSIGAVRAVDTSTHPSYQGKGIFKRLTLGLVEEMTEGGIGFVFNTPNEKSRPGYLKMGWATMGRLSLWVLPRRPHVLLRTLLGKRPADLPEDDAGSGWSAADSQQALRAASDTLLRNAAPNARYHTPIDFQYLDWRYSRCPAVSYGVISTEPRRALVICRIKRRRQLRELTICDLFVEPTLAGVKEAAQSIRAAVRLSSPDYVVAALRQSGPETAALVASGFVPAPRLGPIVTVRELAGWAGAPDPRSPSSWHASIGDLELF